jgi:hypothetical protein
LVILCVGAVVLFGGGGWFSEGDAVSDGDLFGSDEDVFDEQSQHPLAVFDGGVVGLVPELGEEVFQVGGEFEVDLLVGELAVESVELSAQVCFPGAQVGHAGAQLVDGDQLFSERFDHAGDPGGGFGQRGLQTGALLDGWIGGAGGLEAFVDLGVNQVRVSE